MNYLCFQIQVPVVLSPSYLNAGDVDTNENENIGLVLFVLNRLNISSSRPFFFAHQDDENCSYSGTFIRDLS